MSNLERLTKGVETIRLLRDYGILDTKTIMQITKADSTGSLVRRNLETLENYRLVTTRRTGPQGRSINYYQLCQNSRRLEVMAKLLSCTPDELRQPGVHFANLPHEQACALVQKSLRDAYPEALILRDWQFHSNQEVKGLFPKGGLERKMYPDLTVKFAPTTQNPKPTWLGVEVERTRKSDERLGEKIHLYASRSFFDGVVYFSPTDLLLRRIGHIFNDEVRPDAHRINYYGDYFLAAATLPTEIFDANGLLVSCGSEVLWLTNWISFLCNTPTIERGRLRPC